MTWVRRTGELYRMLKVDDTPLTRRRVETFLNLAVRERLQEVSLEVAMQELQEAISDPKYTEVPHDH